MSWESWESSEAHKFVTLGPPQLLVIPWHISHDPFPICCKTSKSGRAGEFIFRALILLEEVDLTSTWMQILLEEVDLRSMWMPILPLAHYHLQYFEYRCFRSCLEEAIVLVWLQTHLKNNEGHALQDRKTKATRCECSWRVNPDESDVANLYHHVPCCSMEWNGFFNYQHFGNQIYKISFFSSRALLSLTATAKPIYANHNENYTRIAYLCCLTGIANSKGV